MSSPAKTRGEYCVTVEIGTLKLEKVSYLVNTMGISMSMISKIIPTAPFAENTYKLNVASEETVISKN